MKPRLTPAERHALLALLPGVPRHPEDLRRRDRVRASTLQRLAFPPQGRPKLLMRLELKPATWLKTPYHPFYQLTDAGEAARKAIAA